MISERNVHSYARLWREIHLISAKRNVIIGEQNASAELHKRYGARGIAGEIVLNVERSEAYAVGILPRLGEIIDRNGLKFVLNGPRTEVKQRISEAKSGVKDADIAASAAHTVPALREKLEFARAAGDVLGAQIAAKQQ